MKEPLVSVIIPAKNSEVTLRKCLASIIDQSYSNVEIIVIDDNSTDQTRLIARSYGALVYRHPSNRSSARNRGARLSHGKFLLHLDSDMELTPKVIEKCVELCETKGLDTLTLPEISVGEGFWADCLSLEKRCYIGNELIEGIRFIRQGAFEKIEGFDPDLEAGEDWDLKIRLRKAGFKERRIEDVVVHHQGKLRLSEIVRKKHNYGKTINKYIQKHQQISKLQMSPWRFVESKSTLWKDPMHTLGLMLIKACEFFAFQIGRFTSRPRRA